MYAQLVMAIPMTTSSRFSVCGQTHNQNLLRRAEQRRPHTVRHRWGAMVWVGAFLCEAFLHAPHALAELSLQPSSLLLPPPAALWSAC